MKTPYGHLSYCSNIHTGEIWTEHFAQLQAHVPAVKAQVSPNQKMGLGLRFANQASIDLQDSARISELKTWLKEQNLFLQILLLKQKCTNGCSLSSIVMNHLLQLLVLLINI